MDFTTKKTKQLFVLLLVDLKGRPKKLKMSCIVVCYDLQIDSHPLTPNHLGQGCPSLA